MKYGSQKHHRRSIRLKGYDYAAPGGYFVTIVTQGRECLLGEIVNGEMRLSAIGRIVTECWEAILAHFSNAELGAYVVMPNHVHGIIVIRDDYRADGLRPPVGTRHASSLPPRGAPPKSIGAIVGSFKSAVTRRAGREINSANIWQRNYYEHIIRDNADWERIGNYITANPSNWVEDEENPINIR